MAEKKGWIDGLKGVAICGIVMIHSGVVGVPAILLNFVGIGQNGVQLFFLLSAYLTFCSMEHTFRTDFSVRKIILWEAKKFVRLAPLFYLAVLICTLFTEGNFRWLGNELVIRKWNVISHLFFLHGFFPHYSNSILGVEWYLGVLAIFYFLAPFLFRLVNSLEKSVLMWVVTTFSCKIICHYAYAMIPNVSDAHVYEAYFGCFWLFSQLSVLVSGIVLFFLVKDASVYFEKNKKSNRMVLSGSLVFFALVMIWGMAFDKNELFGIQPSALFGIWFLILSLGMYIYPWKIIDNAVFRCLGKYSYAIYLFHNIFLGKINDIHFHSNLGINWIVKYVVTLSVSVILSFVLVNLFEQPMITAFNKLLARGSNDKK